MRTFIFMILAAAYLLLTGCDVHQWPECRPDPYKRVTVRLRFDPDLYLWEHYYDPKREYPEEVYPDAAVDDRHPGTTEVYSNALSTGEMFISLKVYNAGNNDNSVAEYTFTRDLALGYDCDVEIELLDGSYEMVVWSHLLEDSYAASYYEPGDFRGVYIIGDNYCGSTDYRDCFRGRAPFSFPVVEVADDDDDVTEYLCEVDMRRPLGKFEFVTTDLTEFLDREAERRGLSTRADIDDYRVVISYPYYYPNAYSIITDDITSDSGYLFETKMTVTGQSEASMGFDYVFIKNIPDGAVQAQVAVFDLAGNRVANSQVIMVPIRRDHHTLLRGTFLSMDAKGGVGVNPDYDGDHNVTM
ncbi:MAG: hypothetical protein J1D86_08255 [Alistipes sp.]|nr:hypothetical protein [Alistipes sp.]